MKQITIFNRKGLLLLQKMLPLFFIAVALTSGQSYKLEGSESHPGEGQVFSGIKTMSTGDYYLLTHTIAVNNYWSLHGIGFSAYQAYSDDYASDEDEYNADLYKQQKQKYGVMSAVFGALSVTSIILMSVGEWEKTTTATGVRINAVDGASATGLIMSLVSFPMTIYSLIRLGISSSKSREYQYGFITPRVDPVIAYDFHHNSVTARLNLTF